MSAINSIDIATQKLNRATAIAETIIATAKVLGDQLSQLPCTNKRQNVFIKSYNRRPNVKRKRDTVIVKMIATTYMNAMQIERIRCTPIPKRTLGESGIVIESGPEMIKLK